MINQVIDFFDWISLSEGKSKEIEPMREIEVSLMNQKALSEKKQVAYPGNSPSRYE